MRFRSPEPEGEIVDCETADYDGQADDLVCFVSFLI